ncbi:type II toxin-antitoxin system RelE/ParE family toxin [Candidatus Peregrinibacteria bacterium]|jgi:mRNA interferase RelE/StbE|nr:type II toxin-antitoxin system RelE/ParE family toxin [Candidatus Peregrinibacteria bacterium]MBT4632064.1 type II toxin-antitoxin system RelE/ParE family toxin [Candidatus Peregrinibacteria bacterium]MBT5516297.1 type II toxin-antitoxin system RelE/ParE family toxin [Candidatus Peregrinibacteria bacterium]MBT5823718.1 type II toxin-antitoxin system RelE/ParE family toxin [Candidatus Peregrinibacteria bacterium]
MYKVIYSENAVKELRKIDKQIAQRIIKKIHFFSEQKEIQTHAKKLKGFVEKFRFRIGDYRAIFSIDKKGKIKILKILNIKHRKDIYEK